MSGPVIAIDGPGGSGKSTVAKQVASTLGAAHVDTGAMYRAFALFCLQSGADPADENEVLPLVSGIRLGFSGDKVVLSGLDVTSRIRQADVSAASSLVAQYASVRRRMVDLQREIAMSSAQGAVIEGRDIGTVVLPEADLKIFLTADPDERARRRANQAGISFEEANADLSERDARDTGRAESPLRPAEDAVKLDTTGMSLDRVVETVIELARAL